MKVSIVLIIPDFRFFLHWTEGSFSDDDPSRWWWKRGLGAAACDVPLSSRCTRADLLPAEVVEAGSETVAILRPCNFPASCWKGSGSSWQPALSALGSSIPHSVAWRRLEMSSGYPLHNPVHSCAWPECCYLNPVQTSVQAPLGMQRVSTSCWQSLPLGGMVD